MNMNGVRRISGFKGHTVETTLNVNTQYSAECNTAAAAR